MVKNALLITVSVLITVAILNHFHTVNFRSDERAQAYMLERISVLENRIDALGGTHNKLVDILQGKKLIN